MSDEPHANSPADLGWSGPDARPDLEVSLTETQRLVLGRVSRGKSNDFADCAHLFALDDLRRMRLIQRVSPRDPFTLTPAGARALATARRRDRQ